MNIRSIFFNPFSIIAFFSGATGLAYEVIYSRLISYYFGDLNFVIMSVLMSCFLGLALGYIYSKKFTKYLWAIELILSLYALATAAVFAIFGIGVLKVLPKFLLLPSTVPLISFLSILIPMFLIGFSVPILSDFAKINKQKKTGFAKTYGIYTLGSALALLLLEILFLEFVGVIICLISMGALNLLLSGYLYVYTKKSLQEVDFEHESNFRWATLPFLFGVVSMIFQYLFLEATYKIYGGSVANFTYVLISALLGISVGSYLSIRSSGKDMYTFFVRWMIIGLIPFLFFKNLIHLWTEFTAHNRNILVTDLIHFFLIFLTSFPMFLIFGSVVPVYLKKYLNAQSNHVLFANALGNALGIFLAAVVLFPIFDLSNALVGIPIFIFLLIFRFLKKAQVYRYGSVILFLIISIAILWPTKELTIGFRRINAFTLNKLKDNLSSLEVKHKFRSMGNETVIYQDSQSVVYVHNGYASIHFYGENPSIIIGESFFGLVPSFYSVKNKKALTIGLGVGMTASALADVNESVKVFEINPATKAVAKIFKKENNNLLDKKNVEIVWQDGFLGTFLEPNETYDVIVQSSSNAHYYSSSKMFSKEFFEIAKSKLTAGGLFSVWYGGTVPIYQIKTLYKTLTSVFNECRTFFLLATYHSIVCSKDAHDFSNERGLAKPVRTKLSQNLLSYIPYLELDFIKPYKSGDFGIKSTVPINTLNKLQTKRYRAISAQEESNRYSVFYDLISSSKVWSSHKDKVCNILRYDKRIDCRNVKNKKPIEFR